MSKHISAWVQLCERTCASVSGHVLFTSTNTDGEVSLGVSGDEMKPCVEHGGSSSSSRIQLHRRLTPHLSCQLNVLPSPQGTYSTHLHWFRSNLSSVPLGFFLAKWGKLNLNDPPLIGWTVLTLIFVALAQMRLLRRVATHRKPNDFNPPLIYYFLPFHFCSAHINRSESWA